MIRRQFLSQLCAGFSVLAPGLTARAATGCEPAMHRLTRYFEAINQRDFVSAFGIWEKSEGLLSVNGQTLEAFRQGFQATEAVTATLGTPTGPEGAAGSNYVDIPVTLDATLKDGRTQRFEGTYTMRLSNMSDDRKYYIYKAVMRQVQ